MRKINDHMPTGLTGISIFTRRQKEEYLNFVCASQCMQPTDTNQGMVTVERLKFLLVNSIMQKYFSYYY